MKGIEYTNNSAFINGEFLSSNKKDIFKVVSQLKELIGGQGKESILSQNQVKRAHEFISWVNRGGEGQIELLCSDIDEIIALTGGDIARTLQGFKPKENPSQARVRMNSSRRRKGRKAREKMNYIK